MTKGLKLTKEFIEKIASQKNGITDIRECIEPFASFDWDGFNQNEFFHLIDSFMKLDAAGCFSNIPDNYLFVFNYTNIVTEMDIVTILSEKNKDDVFIDIEVKNQDSDDVFRKMENQLNNRIDAQMPKFLKNGRYLLVGMVNNQFYKSYYFDGKQTTEIPSLDKLDKILNSYSPLVGEEAIIYHKSDIASLFNICDELREGKYPFHDDTEILYREIMANIEKHKAIFVYGDAGSGKSVLALRLFFQNEKVSKFLLMNSKLYYFLNLGYSLYSEGRTTFRPDEFIGFLKTDTIAIIDESQHLSLDEMEQIIRQSQCAIFFGDEKQAWREKSTNLNQDKLKQYFSRKGFPSYSKRLNNSKRYSDETNKAITSLIYFDEQTKDKRLPYGYDIYITFKQKTFLDRYDKCKGLKKIYCPYSDTKGKEIEISGRKFPCASSLYDDFSANNDTFRYGSTFHAFSFDVDDCFVYLPNTISIKYEDKDFFFSNSLEKNGPNIIKYQNELNVLFTRGRKSLTICANDISAYLLLRKRWLKLKIG